MTAADREQAREREAELNPDDNTHLRVWRFFGLKLAVANHFYSVRPAGEQLAVKRSIWIYTRRRAWGIVHARPWGLIQNLRVYVFGDCYETEGEICVYPPRKFEPKFQPGGFPLRIESRNTAAVNGSIRFELMAYTLYRDEPAFASEHTVLFHAEPATTIQVKFPAPVEIHKITYEIEPDPGANKWQRLDGRPEWMRSESR
jgi:hypothetical protein